MQIIVTFLNQLLEIFIIDALVIQEAKPCERLFPILKVMASASWSRKLPFFGRALVYKVHGHCFNGSYVVYGSYGYPNPTRHPVSISSPDQTQFSFENHRVAGNPKYQVLPDVSSIRVLTVVNSYFRFCPLFFLFAFIYLRYIFFTLSASVIKYYRYILILQGMKLTVFDPSTAEPPGHLKYIVHSAKCMLIISAMSAILPILP